MKRMVVYRRPILLTWYLDVPLSEGATIQVEVFPESGVVGVDVLAPTVQELMQTRIS